MELKLIYEKIRPILEEYLNEKNEIENQIKNYGTIDVKLCALCKKRTILNVTKFEEEVRKTIPEFIEWLRSNSITEFRSNRDTLTIESRKEIVEGKKPVINYTAGGVVIGTNQFVFKKSELRKKPFFRLFGPDISNFAMCKHLQENEMQKAAYPVVLTVSRHYLGFSSTLRAEDMWAGEQTTNTLKFLCKECYERIGGIGCEEGITKRGFAYDAARCSFRKVLLECVLARNNIRFESSLSDFYFEPLTLYLPELSVFLTDQVNNKDEIEKIKPSCILSFSGKEGIFKFLQYETNVILFDESENTSQRFFIFDKEKKVEDSIEKMVTAMIEKLEEYSSQLRGKEHDRLTGAFQRIGKDLGFISQIEHEQKGARVDVVWLNRRGEVEVAIEVETSSEWKKDIVSTWEAIPKLAVILSHAKTDKGTQEIIRYVLLENMPHKLLFINYMLKKAFLIEKQKVVKFYDLDKKGEILPSQEYEEF